MKKIFVLLLVICSFALCLTACSGTTETEVSEMESTVLAETTVETEAPTLEATQEVATSVPEATEPVLAEGEVIVTSMSEFQTAVQDATIKVILINASVELDSEISFERNDDLEIHIQKDGILTINANFTPVACAILNDGSIIVNGFFERGISNLTNNGQITVNAGGTVAAGMSNTENYGAILVETDAELVIDRGSVFNNFGDVTINGHMSVSDGGQLNDEGGSITNNGTIDLSSYFNGDVANISGAGILNDNRE